MKGCRSRGKVFPSLQPAEDRRRRFIRFVTNRFLVPLSRERPGSEAARIIEERATGRDAYMKTLASFGLSPVEANGS